MTPDSVSEKSPCGTTYRGEALRNIAMPLGGIGAGQIALCGDGSLRQWQIVNQANHVAHVPHSFFAIRVCSVEPPVDTIRILQSRDVFKLPAERTPLVNDDLIPTGLRQLLEQFTGVERTVFTGAYPFARVAYEDPALPVEATLEAWSPFVPLDAEASAMPAIIFSFHLRNRIEHTVHGCLGAAIQNAVGWDGITPIAGNRCSLYGGNTNRVRQSTDALHLIMENPTLADDHPSWGQMVLSALSPTARPYERWTTPEQFIRALEGFHLDKQLTGPTSGLGGHAYVAQRAHKNSAALPVGASPQGQTWNGGFLAPFRLLPAEEVELPFVLAWYFPNRYVNFEQSGPPRQYGKSRFWLGNSYAGRFADAEDVADHVVRHRHALRESSVRWTSTIFDGSLPEWIAEAISVQPLPLRSPTCFWTADGNFFGFEGALGASTGMWNGTYGGSCALNCTHVWNYEQALSRLFPRLERTMREVELEVMQAPEGYIPHRLYAPLYLPQLWNVPIGGPERPALDGMLGTILKMYREVRLGAGLDWLDRLLPSVTSLLSYIIDRWDPDDDGVLLGEQPNTYDISFYGVNTFIGSLWLAALRAMEEMALLRGEGDRAREIRARFDRGSARYDELLWNGEYYCQVLRADDPRQHQYGDGCLSDQLLGQWWAHLLDLGYILPREHVRTALQSIVRYNVRRGFDEFEHSSRIFADRDDAGLLVCTWPRGRRPTTPLLYADEVWTGIEYQVGTHCIMEGLVDEGFAILKALRARYSGSRRNPYNEIECGDHYARSLAGWSVLEAVSGFRYSAVDDSLRFSPAISHDYPASTIRGEGHVRLPFLTATGWGTYTQEPRGSLPRIVLTASWGDIKIRQLTIPRISEDTLTVTVDGAPIAASLASRGPDMQVTLDPPLVLTPGSSLEVRMESKPISGGSDA